MLADLHRYIDARSSAVARLQRGAHRSLPLRERIGNTIIERGDDEQLETALNEVWEERLRVEWVDGCTYRLYPPPAPKDDKPGLAQSLIVTTHITEVNELGYSAKVWWSPPPCDTLTLHYKRMP